MLELDDDGERATVFLVKLKKPRGAVVSNLTKEQVVGVHSNFS